MTNALNSNQYRGPRWVAALLVLILGVAGLLLGWFQVCSEETTTQNKLTAVQTTCAQPSVTDAAVVGTVLLIVLLLLPEMSEIGVFGVSLKRRVEDAEREASESKQKTESLEGRIFMQSARIDSLTQSVASAAAQASVGPILIGDAAIQHALSTLPEKEKAFQTGADSSPIHEMEEPIDGRQVARLIRNWERIAASLDLPPYRHDRGSNMDRIPVSAAAAERFRTVFREELQLVRAARNTVAHAGLLEPEQLDSAVDISVRLLQILGSPGTEDPVPAPA